MPLGFKSDFFDLWVFKDAGTCLDRLRFRGLRDGLTAVREAVTEAREPAPELRLF